MRRLFISRNLDKNSVFYRLNAEGIKVSGQSLIQFKKLDFEIPPSYDWVFFYSPFAIKTFFEKVGYSDQLSYGVMGEGSANIFKAINSSLPDYIANTSSEHIIEALKSRVQNKKLLIPRAKHSIHFLKNAFDDDQIIDLGIYSNEIKHDIDIPESDILVFTSPANVEAYFNKYDYKEEKLFAIGKTTASKIFDLTSQKVQFCPIPGIENLYNLIRSSFSN